MVIGSTGRGAPAFFVYGILLSLAIPAKLYEIYHAKVSNFDLLCGSKYGASPMPTAREPERSP